MNPEGKTVTTNLVDAPGSWQAISKGCTCPVIDNHYGKGRLTETGVAYIIMGDCPIHGKREAGTYATRD